MFKVYAIRRAIISACRNFLQHTNSTQMCIHDEEGEKNESQQVKLFNINKTKRLAC